MYCAFKMSKMLKLMLRIFCRIKYFFKEEKRFVKRGNRSIRFPGQKLGRAGQRRDRILRADTGGGGRGPVSGQSWPQARETESGCGLGHTAV